MRLACGKASSSISNLSTRMVAGMGVFLSRSRGRSGAIDFPRRLTLTPIPALMSMMTRHPHTVAGISSFSGGQRGLEAGRLRVARLACDASRAHVTCFPTATLCLSSLGAAPRAVRVSSCRTARLSPRGTAAIRSGADSRANSTGDRHEALSQDHQPNARRGTASPRRFRPLSGGDADLSALTPREAMNARRGRREHHHPSAAQWCSEGRSADCHRPTAGDAIAALDPSCRGGRC